MCPPHFPRSPENWALKRLCVSATNEVMISEMMLVNRLLRHNAKPNLHLLSDTNFLVFDCQPQICGGPLVKLLP